MSLTPSMLSSYAGTAALCLLTYFAVRGLVSAVWSTLIRPGKNLRKYGEWAIITGATDGIGKALSFELAKRGLNILLISRSAPKLNEVAEEITKKYGNIKTKCLAIDFSKFDAAAQGKVSAEIENMDVGILINNVGMSYSYPEYFSNLSRADVQSLLELNINSTTIMTHIVLPRMVSQKRGAVVSISSASSQIPTGPFLAEYSAAKAYVDKFSQSLSVEYAKQNIHFQVQNPLYVVSKLSKFKRATAMIPTPEAYARCAVRVIGYETQISPYFLHAAQLWFMSLLPTNIINNQVSAMHYAIRKKALKKLEQEGGAGDKAGKDK